MTPGATLEDKELKETNKKQNRTVNSQLWLVSARARSAIAAQLVPLILIGAGSDGSPRDRISAGWRGSPMSARCMGHSEVTRQGLRGCKVASDGREDNGDIS